MKKEMTKTQLLFISFAAIFGSGWLFAPYYAAQIAGPASLVAWMIGALLSAVIGLTMAEVVVLLPESGGMSLITRRTHGDFLATITTLLNLIVFILLPAIETRAVLQYASTYLPALLGPDDSFSVSGLFVAFSLLSLITAVNLYGSQMMISITKAVVFFKILTPVLVCVVFFYTLGFEGSFDGSRLELSDGTLQWDQIFQAIATTGIIFSFNGFNQATLFAGEAKNPKKAIPFAILGSLAVSTLLYVVIQYAFLMAVPKASLAGGWSSLSFLGEEGPFVGLSKSMGLSSLLILIYLDAVISPLGTAFSYASAAPKLLSTLVHFKRTNRFGVPPLLIALSLILECLAFLFLPSLKAMISLLVAAFVLCYTVAPASLLTLRRFQPRLYRPFRIPLPRVLSYLSLFFSNLMAVSCGYDPLKKLGIGVGLFLIPYALLKGRIFLKEVRGSEWFLFQILTLPLCTYLYETYLLSFWFLGASVALLSAVALLLSQAFPAPQD